MNIVFYDGRCGLCHRVVRWLLRIDRRRRLTFAPLEGGTAKRLLPRRPVEVDAIVYWREGQPLLDSSSAIGTILGDMAWPWRALSVMLWVPQGLRDWAYRAVAGKRYRLFGHYENCPLPEAAVRERFLD